MATRFARGRSYKTKDYNILKKLTEETMDEYMDSLGSFRGFFDPSAQFLSISYVFYIPRNKFYTKKNEVSLHSTDLDNSIKPLQDIIFRYMGIDDKHICDLSAFKRPYSADDYMTSVTININDFGLLE